VANPRRVRLIYAKGQKSDRLDAECLASLLRADPTLLSPIHHRSEGSQIDLAVIRNRAALVRGRTFLVNHARGLVKSLGPRLPSCSSERFARLEQEISGDLSVLLGPVSSCVAELTQQIKVDARTEWCVPP
jgi:transposase